MHVNMRIKADMVVEGTVFINVLAMVGVVLH
jgi:hypothetical protein